jgi:hypothetical protein
MPLNTDIIKKKYVYSNLEENSSHLFGSAIGVLTWTESEKPNPSVDIRTLVIPFTANPCRSREIIPSPL